MRTDHEQCYPVGSRHGSVGLYTRNTYAISRYKIIMYADNVVFYTTSTNMHIAESKLQHDATKVYNWFCKSGLVIHTGKTKVELFNPPMHPRIKMGKVALHSCSSYEYLGIILYDNITLKSTISKNVSSASNRCYMLGNLRHRMSLHTGLLVYRQTIMPVLEYCGYLFNGVVHTQHKRLQQMQTNVYVLVLMYKNAIISVMYIKMPTLIT